MSTPSLVALPISGQLDEPLIRNILHNIKKDPVEDSVVVMTAAIMHPIMWDGMVENQDEEDADRKAIADKSIQNLTNESTRCTWMLYFGYTSDDHLALRALAGLDIAWFKTIVSRALHTTLHGLQMVLVGELMISEVLQGLQDYPVETVVLDFRVSPIMGDRVQRGIGLVIDPRVHELLYLFFSAVGNIITTRTSSHKRCHTFEALPPMRPMGRIDGSLVAKRIRPPPLPYGALRSLSHDACRLIDEMH